MNPLTVVLLLVTCNDSFQNCHAAEDTLRYYQNIRHCEAAIDKKMAALSYKDQQIFGKCIPIDTIANNNYKKKALVHWNVTKQGDLYIALAGESDNTL